MKVKEGKVKLGRNDYRVGNFVCSIEKDGDYVSIQDINGVFKIRVATFTAKGRYLLILIKDKEEQMLANVIATAFNANMVVPDVQYMDSLTREATACMERHRQLYGAPEGEAEDDDRILQEQKDIHELLDRLGDEDKELLN